MSRKPLPNREDFIQLLIHVRLPELRKLGAWITVDELETAVRFMLDEDRAHGEQEAPKTLN
jgi:hypothetical protein